MQEKKAKNLLIAWTGYQRRSELIAPLLNADLVYIPSQFRSKYLRLFDYLIKLFLTFRYILAFKPDVVFVQAPPAFAAIPALLLGVPCVIDAHNGVFQGMWVKVPLTRYLIERSQGMIVHNSEILQVAKERYPNLKVFVIADPIGVIKSETPGRNLSQLLLICSLNKDEPVDLILDTIEQLPEYTVIFPGNLNKISPSQRERLQQFKQVKLTGFLDKPEYQAMLTSSQAAIVLSTRVSNQPSGACEALSSDTPLIVSRTSLVEKLFGEWAALVDNSVESVVQAIRSLQPEPLDLSEYRDQWNSLVQQEVQQLMEYLESLRSQSS